MSTIKELEANQKSLISDLEKKLEQSRDKTLFDCTSDKNSANVSFRRAFKLKGHTEKVFDLSWCDDSQHVVTASQDGKMIIFDTYTGAKERVIQLRSQYVTACAYGSGGGMVASGGLDNTCTLWSLREEESVTEKPVAEMGGHNGFISGLSFLSESSLLSTSGDGTAKRWDLNRKTSVQTFSDHDGDVMGLTINPLNTNMFCTCAIDKTVRLWDVREKNCVQTVYATDTDVNCVTFFPCGNAVAIGDEAGVIKLIDFRAGQSVGQYAEEREEEDMHSGVASLSFSNSGRLLFAGYYHENILVWDTLTGEYLCDLRGHLARVSALAVSPDGVAICSGGWDNGVNLFLPR